jgi:hypothetical protein
VNGLRRKRPPRLLILPSLSLHPLEFAADDHLASSINAMHLKHRLRDVETGCRDRRATTTSRPTIWDHRLHTNLVRIASSLRADMILGKDSQSFYHSVAAIPIWRLLDWRARHCSVRTEHAAIARQRFKLLSATLAYIEELAGIGRHLLDRLVPAPGASEFGFDLHQGDCRIIS